MRIKLTKTNFKTFLRKNVQDLYLRKKTTFDGMVDGCVDVDKGFIKAERCQEFHEHNYGYKGIWLVGGGRDYFEKYNDAGFDGIRVDNCCGSFIVAIKVAA